MLNQNEEVEENKNQISNIIDFNSAKSKIIHSKPNEKEQEEVVTEYPIGSMLITPSELAEELADSYVLGKQEVIYQSVVTFLSTLEAVTSGIVGVEMGLKNGYVWCDWKYGEREEGDIKNGR